MHALDFQHNLNSQMNKSLFVVLLLLGTAYLGLSATQDLNDKAFENFKTQYRKQYGPNSGQGDENYRKQVFLDNKAKIEKHNSDSKQTYKMGINELADLSQVEFANIYLNLKPLAATNQPSLNDPNTAKSQTPTISITAITSIDWVVKGKVTAVRNQGYCGSCWAFSAVAALESGILLKNSTTTNLSEQELVDCSGNYGNNGCGGGWMNNAFNYIRVVGISTETAYPYVGVQQGCKAHTGAIYKVSGYNYTTGCASLAQGIFSRPYSVAVDAGKWQLYGSGIFGNCGVTINHGVLLVGYTSTYWKIKNSWGTSWGEAGYIRLSPGNTCNICTYPSYPYPI